MIEDRILLCAPCLFGIEGILAQEIRYQGFDVAEVTDGRVYFYVENEEGIAKANITLRCAERILIVLGRFHAESFDDLFEGTKKLAWERWIGKEEAFPVKGHAVRSKLFSVPDCQSIVKKAIVSRLQQVYGLAWFAETGAKHQAQFSLMKDEACLMLDTSGPGLHKRGYRPISTAAPLRETLAAAIVKLAKFKYYDQLYDPMCGTGTIAIEAVMIGRNIAPGLLRRFDAEKWAVMHEPLWDEARQNAKAQIRPANFVVHAADIDPQAVQTAEQAAKMARIGSSICFSCADVRDFTAPDPKGVVVTNPPYGERLLEKKEAALLYTDMGKAFARLPADWRLNIIAPEEGFEAAFGRKAEKTRRLYNGMIKCRLYQYFAARR